MRRLLLALTLSSGCAAAVDVPPHVDATVQLRAIDPVDDALLARLAADADARPEHEAAQFRAGIEHAHAVLVGHFRHRDAAEHYLLRAHALDPGRSPATLVLARFLNLRASVLDLSRIDLQAELYRIALERELAACGAAPSDDAAHLQALLGSTLALAAWDDRRPLEALHRVRALERQLAHALTVRPEDIDAHAMAANFELTWAGVISVGSERRRDAGIAHLQHAIDRWSALSPGARDVGLAPNVQSVFTLALAEAQLAAGRTDDAARTYERLLALDVPHTRPRAQIEALARHRLDHLDAYAGDADLLPPWPHGPTGCVACHARTTELPATGLHLRGAIPW